MIVINIDKARAVAHEARRVARAAEFAPWDHIIAMRIPGTAATEAEAQRQEIRERNAIVQAQIEAATDHQQLRSFIERMAAVRADNAA